MKSERELRLFGLGLCASALLFACSGPALIDDPSEQAEGTGGSGSNEPTSGGGAGETSNEPDDFPGVDVPEPPADPPAGCVDGFDRETGELALFLDAEVPVASVRIDEDERLLVNDNSCTDADGSVVRAEDIVHLTLMGDESDNTVILDFESGDWSNLLERSEVIALSLGEGANQLLIRGTSGSDSLNHGMLEDALLLDLVGDGTSHLRAEGVGELALNLGDGDDTVGALSEAFFEGEEEPVELTSLNIALFAFGGAGDDWLLGGERDDELDGGPGNDTLSGLGGNDSFACAETADGADVVNGGPGFDELLYTLRTENLEIALCTSEATVGCEAESCDCSTTSGEAGENDTIINVESITGGRGDDHISGTSADESFFGGDGDDELVGNAGSDVLLGQLGTDVLEGGLDEDICDGQEGELISSCEI